jgi:hypothetical protein
MGALLVITQSGSDLDWCYQSILGLLKPCLKSAAAGCLWAKEGQEEGEGLYDSDGKK